MLSPLCLVPALCLATYEVSCASYRHLIISTVLGQPGPNGRQYHTQLMCARHVEPRQHGIPTGRRQAVLLSSASTEFPRGDDKLYFVDHVNTRFLASPVQRGASSPIMLGCLLPTFRGFSFLYIGCDLLVHPFEGE